MKKDETPAAMRTQVADSRYKYPSVRVRPVSAMAATLSVVYVYLYLVLKVYLATLR